MSKFTKEEWEDIFARLKSDDHWKDWKPLFTFINGRFERVAAAELQT